MDGITRRRGHYLPHWTKDEAVYFVTFRLADSMPHDVQARLKEDFRQDMRAEERPLRRPLSPDDIRRFKARRRNQTEKYLDASHGACYLRTTACAQIVRSALEYFDGDRYALGTWAIMPNHVHALVQPMATNSLEAIVKTWKNFSARRINEIVGRTGRLWQREAFDHIVRSEESFHKFTKYIAENPTNAGLIDWPWIGVGKLGRSPMYDE